MAFVTLPNWLRLFGLYLEGGFAPSLTSALMDASGEAVGFTLVAPKAGTISKIGFRTGTVTTGQSLDIRIETVGSDMFPSGTLWAANTNGNQAILDTDDNKWFWVTLTAGAVVAQGQQFCVAIRWVSTVGNLNIAYTSSSTATAGGVPFAASYTTSWAFTAAIPNIAVEYSSPTSRPFLGTLPVLAHNSITFNNGSSPDEIGIIFQYPVPCKIIGAIAKINEVVTTFAVKLYDSDGSTVLESVTNIDAESNQASSGQVVILFDTQPIINANMNYRLTLLPETAASITTKELEVDTASTMEALDGGANIYRTDRTDAGAWSQTTTKRPLLTPLISAIDSGPSPIYAMGI